MDLRRLLCAAALLVTACHNDDSPPAAAVLVPRSSLELKSFEGDTACQDFLDYLADAFTDQFLTTFYCPPPMMCPVFLGPPMATDGSVAGAASPSAPAAPERVSGTNVQEAGVDESDLVKADAAGNLFIVTGSRLVVVPAFPPEGLATAPQAVLDLSAGDAYLYASELFLDEAAHRAVVLASSYANDVGRAVAIIVDVSDPAAPAEVTRVAVDGYPLAARRVGSRVHRASRFYIPLPAEIYGDATLVQQRDDYAQAVADGHDEAAAKIRDDVRASIGGIVDGMGADAFLPHLHTGAADTPLACTDVARPDVTTGAGLLVIDSFGTDGGTHAATAAINNAWLVYGSASNFYAVQSSFGWFFARDQAEQSAVYRFALGSGAPQYKGVGSLRGNALGPYALSESAGFLRAATTDFRWEDGHTDIVNRLSVLRLDDDAMPAAAELKGFSPGEAIRGVRFDGDRGFVVTFRQVDPLFAFDLSDPEKPRLASELTIPGFSSYLMPLGSDYLLTIGRAGDETALTGQVGIQLFDVRDLTDIRLVDGISPAAGDGSYSWSMAEYDPHAFAFFADDPAEPATGTLSIPLQVYGPDTNFGGFLVVRVDPAAFAPLLELGRIDHTALVGSDGCYDDGNGGTVCPYVGWVAEPLRSVFMQDDTRTILYTLSAAGILANDAAAPSTEYGKAKLPYEQPACCFVDGVATSP